MFALATLFATVAVAVYLLTPRLRTTSRILLALSIFIVGCGVVIAALVFVGDRPQGCSQNVYLNGELGPVENCD